ncbi:MAG: hypothetical protein PHQ34_13130 [Methanothrix sp.]|nr:hypothetical protein [Methanothrix sp.]
MFFPLSSVQASVMDDVSVAQISENCDKWKVSFNWSEMDAYKRSVSQGNSETGNVKTLVDTLVMTSSADAKKVLKVSVIMYSKSIASQVSSSVLMNMANDTLSKSGVCGNISLENRTIDGRPGIYASGVKCPLGNPVYAAIFPVSYHLDRPGGVLDSNALTIVLSTYDREITDRFVNSVKIEQTK